MLKKQKRVIIGVALVAAVAAAYVLFGSRLSSLLPKATATGDEVVVAPKTLVFGVDATGLLRATSVQNFGGPPMFANYWNFQIVNLVAEGKQVKAGEQLITFEAQRIREDLSGSRTSWIRPPRSLKRPGRRSTSNGRNCKRSWRRPRTTTRNSS
jgi:hypothetical protein